MENKRTMKTVEIKEDNGNYKIITELKSLPIGVVETIVNSVAEQATVKTATTLNNPKVDELIERAIDEINTNMEAGTVSRLWKLLAIISILFNTYLVLFGGR